MFGAIEPLFFPLFFLFLIPLGLAVFAFWVWMLVHAVQNQGLNDNERLMWVLVILFAHLVGAIIYFFVGKPKGSATPKPNG